MDSIKTAIVLVFLLAIMYGAYVVLNKPLGEVPPEVGWNDEQLQPPEIDFSQPGDELLTAPELPPAGSLAGPAPPASFAPNSLAPEAPLASDAPPLLSAPPPTDLLSDPLESDSNPAPADPSQSIAPIPSGNRGDNFHGEPAVSQAGAIADLPAVTPGPAPGAPTSPAAPEEAPDAAGNFYSQQANRLRQGNGGGSGSGWDSFEESPPTASQPAAPVDGGNPVADSTAPPAAPASPANQVASTPLAPRATPLATTPLKSTDSSPNADPPPAPQGTNFEEAMAAAAALVRQGKPQTALAELSPWHFQELAPAQREQLYAYLDPLAGRVVYSRAHLLSDPHVVREGETLFEIADRYRVPWELLKNINGLPAPRPIPAQTELKVVPGPFRADIDLSQAELTLFVDDKYAGRFAVQVGADPAPSPGSFVIRGRQEGHTYFGVDGSKIEAGDPRNPYGAMWMDLGQGLCLHGGASETANSTSSGGAAAGCLGLRARDAQDVFGILSVGSEVVIRR